MAVGVGRADVLEIETLNIHNASLLAMCRAVDSLSTVPDLALVDGKFTPQLGCEARAIVGGDNREPAIAAASIVAKVSRDRIMVSLDKQYPGYGFAQHKGYPTQEHIRAIEKLGVIPDHRLTFSPVRKLSQNDNREST